MKITWQVEIVLYFREIAKMTELPELPSSIGWAAFSVAHRVLLSSDLFAMACKQEFFSMIMTADITECQAAGRMCRKVAISYLHHVLIW